LPRSSWVSPFSTCQPWCPKILKEFNALVAAAKLPKQRFHDLRYACISLLFAQEIDAKVIAEIVGHSDLRLTRNVYQPQKSAAAAKMDDLLANSRKRAASIPVATKTTATLS
jgi:integrase